MDSNHEYLKIARNIKQRDQLKKQQREWYIVMLILASLLIVTVVAINVEYNRKKVAGTTASVNVVDAIYGVNCNDAPITTYTSITTKTEEKVPSQPEKLDDETTLKKDSVRFKAGAAMYF